MARIVEGPCHKQHPYIMDLPDVMTNILEFPSVPMKLILHGNCAVCLTYNVYYSFQA